MARRPTKPKPVADWQITKIGKVARQIGTVQATDAEAAILRAIEKFEIAPDQQERIAARPIVVRSRGGNVLRPQEREGDDG